MNFFNPQRIAAMLTGEYICPECGSQLIFLVLCLSGPRSFAGLFSFAIFLFATITVPFMKGREYKVPNLTLLFLFVFLDI